MGTYVILGKYTEQGLRTIKDAPGRRAAARQLAESLGGELKQVYLTMGQYDLVVVAVAPDHETVARLCLQIGMQGNLSTETLFAFDEAETDHLLLGV